MFFQEGSKADYGRLKIPAFGVWQGIQLYTKQAKKIAEMVRRDRQRVRAKS